MKTNIKIRVTPEQSRKVQEICFENGIEWLNVSRRYVGNIIILYIGKDLMFSGVEFPETFVETDADLFIRTNGTCEEDIYERVNQHQVLNNVEIKELKDDVAILEQKLKKKNEILKKARIKRKNQREELHKLNLKLQKCISLEEHRKAINWHIERNEALFAEIDNLKAENIEMGKLVNLNKSALDLAVMTKDLAIKTVEEQNKKIEQLKVENKSLKKSSKISYNMLHSQKDKIDRLELNYVSEQSSYKKEIEKLKAVIEYLESKVK